MPEHEQEHDDVATHNTKLKAEGQAQRWSEGQGTGLTYKLNDCQVYNTIYSQLKSSLQMGYLNASAN